jgi:chemotaxis protein methyltransferase CheR
VTAQSCELCEERAICGSAAIAGSETDQSSEVTLLGLTSGAHHHYMRILATNIDPSLLGRAGNAHLCPADPAQVRTYNHLQHVDKTTPPPVARPDFSALEQTRRLNAMPTWPMCCRFAVNLCRSQQLHLAPYASGGLLVRFVNALILGGWLFPRFAQRFNRPAAGQFAARGRTACQDLGVS